MRTQEREELDDIIVSIINMVFQIFKNPEIKFGLFQDEDAACNKHKNNQGTNKQADYYDHFKRQ